MFKAVSVRLSIWPFSALAAAMLLLLTGCGPAPDARQVADLVQAGYDRAGLEEVIAVRSLGIQDRWQKNATRQKLNVGYDIEFLMDYGDAVAQFGQQTDTRGLSLDSLKEGLGLAALRIEFGEFKAGDVVFRKDQLHLRKTEQGWQLVEE